VFSPASPTSVCIVWDRDDAPLISAAPDLLEAAKNLLDLALKMGFEFVCDVDGFPEVRAARAAIAKAEGR
jgi:hypothetical protein